jgi:hypothetical protein
MLTTNPYPLGASTGSFIVGKRVCYGHSSQGKAQKQSVVFTHFRGFGPLEMEVLLQQSTS